MLKRRIYGRLAVIGTKKKIDTKKKTISFFLLITMVCFCISLSPLMMKPVKAVDVTWVGGTPGDWCTDANWSNGVEPTSADNVTISALAVLDVTTSGCVTEGHNINFNTLTIGDGANANTLTLSANIGTGANITIKGSATLTQANTATQTISGTLTVESGGLLTHSENPATHSYEVDFQAATIIIAGSVNIDERGHTGGLGAGNGSGPGYGSYDAGSGNGSGGAHSGAGGATVATAGGTAYCNNNDPSTLGSGGGGSDGTVGGDGGGLARLKATVSITVSGTITANGGTPTVLGPPPATGSGGGGAGAVKLDAPIVDISGSTINVVGGNSNIPDQGGGGGGGCVFISYSTSYTATGLTSSVAGGTGVNNGGAGSFISNAPPTVTTPSAVQTATSTITVTATITDLDKNVTNIIVDYSTNGTTWASSTLKNVSQDGSGDGVTTSTGEIMGIDTNNGSGTQGLTVEWNVGADVLNTDDTSVYLRFVPADSIVTSTAVSSAAFAIDTKSPTAPGNLSVNSTSTNAVILAFGSATVDTGFREYRIFYSQATPVTLADTSLTSSTDANLGAIDFNSKTTTTISSLLENTRYYANIWAYDTWDRTAPSNAEVNFYTLTNTPTGVSATVDSTSQVTVSWTGDGTQYYVENITAGTNSSWISTASYAFSGLNDGTSYSFRVKAKNGDNIETAWSSTVSATTQNSGGGAPVGGNPIPDPKPKPDCNPIIEICDPVPVKLLFINSDAKYTNKRKVTITFNKQYVSSYALSETEDFTGKSFEAITGPVSFEIMSDGDGKKIICGKFQSTFNLNNAEKCDEIILDTIPPKPPQVSYLSMAFGNNEVGYSFWAFGQSELNSTVIITKKNDINAPTFPKSKLYLGESYGQTVIGPLIGTGWFSFNGTPQITPSIFWFDPVPVMVIFQARDYADNLSEPYILKYNLSLEKKPKPECNGNDCGENEFPKDADMDGVPDPLDNCPVTFNPNQSDIDGDGIGDVCDLDDKKDKDCVGDNCQDENKPVDKPVDKPDDKPNNKPNNKPTGDSKPNDSGSSPPTGSDSESKSEVPFSQPIESKKVIITTTSSFGTFFNSNKMVVAVRKIIDNKQVEKINEKIVAPALALAGVTNVVVSAVVGGFQLPQVIIFLRYLFTQPLLLLRLRKRKSWGVIYNSLNKMPVDLAVVRLVDNLTGRIVQSQVTDAQGRYLITVEPGEYHLEVDKVGFLGFSKLLQEKDEDAKFIHLYHGQKFQITEAESVLNYNIPLDQVDEVKDNGVVIREYTQKVTQSIICIIGLVASILSFIISPKLIIFAFVLLHLLFYWLFYRFSHRKVTAGSFGSVTEMIMEEPISKVVVRVFDSMYNKLVDTAVTDHKGRYAVLVGPSKYYTTYEKDGFEKKQSDVLDFSSEKTNGMGGLINRDEELKKI